MSHSMVVIYQLCPSRLFSLVPLFLGLRTSLSLTNAINTAQAYWQYAIANSNVCTSLIYWSEEQRLSIFYHCDSETQNRLEKITFTNYKSFGSDFMKKRQTFADKKTEVAANPTKITAPFHMQRYWFYWKCSLSGPDSRVKNIGQSWWKDLDLQFR